jgi:hypothetical protein
LQPVEPKVELNFQFQTNTASNKVKECI